MTGKVLTPAENRSVAEAARHMGIEHPNCEGCSDLSARLLIWQADYDSMCMMLAEPSENQLLRAENARLRGLIEGMGHEPKCMYLKKSGTYPQVSEKSNCNCVKSQVNL